MAPNWVVGVFKIITNGEFEPKRGIYKFSPLFKMKQFLHYIRNLDL